MGASKNQESARREKDGVIYYDRGVLTGKDGRRYQRYAIQTHFVKPGEDQAEHETDGGERRKSFSFHGYHSFAE